METQKQLSTNETSLVNTDGREQTGALETKTARATNITRMKKKCQDLTCFVHVDFSHNITLYGYKEKVILRGWRAIFLRKQDYKICLKGHFYSWLHVGMRFPPQKWVNDRKCLMFRKQRQIKKGQVPNIF